MEAVVGKTLRALLCSRVSFIHLVRTLSCVKEFNFLLLYQLKCIRAYKLPVLVRTQRFCKFVS